MISSKNQEHPEQSLTICCRENFATVRDQENGNLGWDHKLLASQFIRCQYCFIFRVSGSSGLDLHQLNKAFNLCLGHLSDFFFPQHNKYLLVSPLAKHQPWCFGDTSEQYKRKDTYPHGATSPLSTTPRAYDFGCAAGLYGEPKVKLKEKL